MVIKAPRNIFGVKLPTNWDELTAILNEFPGIINLYYDSTDQPNHRIEHFIATDGNVFHALQLGQRQNQVFCPEEVVIAVFDEDSWDRARRNIERWQAGEVPVCTSPCMPLKTTLVHFPGTIGHKNPVEMSQSTLNFPLKGTSANLRPVQLGCGLNWCLHWVIPVCWRV